MLRRRTIEGLMAQAFYETLSGRDAAILEEHFNQYPEAREEFETLRHFVRSVPAGRPVFDTDLLPAVRVRIEEESAAAARSSWRRPLVFVPSACIAVLVLVFAAGGLRGFVSHNPERANGGSALNVLADTVLAGAIDTALSRVARAEYAEAYRGLSRVLESNPEAQGAGEAQMLLADIAFAHLRWYERAYEDYEHLFQRYHQTWLGSPAQVRDRRDLLAEARLVQFRSLHDLDAACSSSLDPAGALARVIASYPDQAYVRSQAAMEMAKLTIASGAVDAEAPDALVLALQHVQTRTTDPMVAAQLSYQLGHLYESEYREFEKAREAFVHASRHPALQQQARSALARLDAETEQ